MGVRVAEAIRGARLALLGAGNPLGLVDVPFALGTLRLARIREPVAGRFAPVQPC
jgi:hypothetical protein